MPQLLEPESVVVPESMEIVHPQRRRWTRDDCTFLVNNGFLEGRWELIEGEIINKMGQKPLHRICITLLNACLVGIFPGVQVQIQGPIDVADQDNLMNEPEPDAVVLARPTTEIRDGNPAPEDILLLVEVSDTTLRFDQTRKAVRYARAGIADYWIIDIKGRRVLVHREPSRETGGYGQIAAYTEHEMVTSLAAPLMPISVSTLLPPDEGANA
jgi:Uma2 family endonuclease